ncbi:positive regulator of sigma-B [Halalkalibacter wakoensis JCM 9140]|uniref:Positive regulator of sigma-B n=1 Tax=Halalkalibacter wakoensis JCM 9140 TaxID=1236970 RepID=W4Q3A2_9BACI|nr:STAS domain-containing protein [Halalkalibacter wakoensis]GAE26447.1 positive regulator of sigma-B [Halalkalibacter wakoensis JCM 9140]
MQPYIVSLLTNQKDAVLKHWEKELEVVKSNNFLSAINDNVYENMNKEFMDFIMTQVTMEQQEAQGQLSSFAEKYIQAGWPLSYFTQGLQAFRRVLLAFLMRNETDVQVLISTFGDLEEWIDGVINQLVHDYTGNWEDIIEMQKLSLLELSAPLIPVFEGVTVMPLIGTIDTARAKLIMENLLEGVIEHRSQVVLIDITGVPVVDTMVAHHIIQASEAVRLVGASCILVGIRPEIAQTIVNLGIDLSKFPTKSTLQKGIETALEVTNKKMIDL